MPTEGILSRAAIVLALLLTGCDETIEHEGAADASFALDVATAYCGALFACGGSDACATYHEFPYDTETDCLAVEQDRLEDLRTNASAAGMAYNPMCVAQTIAAYATVECRNADAASIHTPEATGGLGFECQPYVGNVPLYDGTCSEVAGTNLSDCGLGAECYDGYCQPAENLSPSCEDICGAGQTCTDIPGVYSASCLPIEPVGETCTEGWAILGYCEPGAFCPRTPTMDGSEEPEDAQCTSQLAVAEPCTNDAECLSFDCGSDGLCVAGEPILCGHAPRLWRSDF